jgi:signal transduction histidine kinase/CheY-like chemotaxis protein
VQGNLIEQEWGYLRDESAWKLAALIAVVGVLPITLDRWLLQAHQVAALGLIFLATAACGLWLARFDLRLSVAGLVVGTTAGVGLAAHWWPTPGVSSLFLLPVGLAVFTLGPIASALVSIAVAWFLLAHPEGYLVAIPRSETIVVVSVAAMLWALSWINEAPRRAMLKQLLVYYRRAQELLEEARDRRLLLNQANQDLTEAYLQLARMTDLLRASRLEAEMARRAKEEFVANVSHELRTPLNMIIGFSEMILRSPATYGRRLPKPLLSDMGVIHRNSQHLAQLINDVLELSQSEAGQMSLNREPVDLVTLVQEAMEAVRPLYQARKLDLKADIPSSAPRVWCDRLRVRQILLNLLSNAGRFTEVGGVRVSVSLKESEVIFHVVDSGPGIPPDRRERIFEPFHQAHAPTERILGGSGLGLSISKRLVELHGGRMWLESDVGRGSKFSFSLPRDRVDLEASDAARWVNPYARYEPRTRPRIVELPEPQFHLLVLEQEDVLQHQVRAHLGAVHLTGVQTIEALKAEVAAGPPDIVLINDAQAMEARHPVCTALGLPARTPVVSCHVPGKREACERLNVVDYLVKPVTHSALLAAAERIAPAGGSLLVVEDDREMGRLIARQLTVAGREYRVLRAEDGAGALAMMRARHPDAVLLDLGLPDKDGYQVLLEKDADPAIQCIPVVIVSARDPLGGAVVASGLQVGLAGGLSARDVILCAAAIGQALSPREGGSRPSGSVAATPRARR